MKSASSSFGKALRAARRAQGLSQEEFDQISSRTYISALERGIKQPTIVKVDQLASILGLHPLTLFALSYVGHSSPADVKRLLERVQHEVDLLSAASRPV